MNALFHSRMDWGLGNPNKTATLVATLMLFVWLLAYVRKWGFWVALTLFFGLGICLVLTLSRGGVIGVILGGLVALAWIDRPFPKSRILGVAIACVGLIALGCLVNEQSRMIKGLSGDDLSVENRLLIWKQAPSMIHDAPNGWGVGQSGNAYMQWYQPVTSGEGYRTLVNSHLTWLVEFNWWGKIAYIVAWIAILVLLWPDAKHKWFSIPLGIWIALAACAAFSSVAESPWLWGIPVFGFACVMFVRIPETAWPSKSQWLSGACVSMALVATLFIWQWKAPASLVHSPREGVVTLGTSSPTLWLISPDVNVLGEHYGHEARRSVETVPVYRQVGFGIAATAKDAPSSGTWVCSAQVPQTIAGCSAVVLISPKPTDSPKVMAELVAIPKVTVIVGEYSQSRDFWVLIAKLHPNIKVQVVEGMEDYISDWAHQIALAIEDYHEVSAPITSK